MKRFAIAMSVCVCGFAWITAANAGPLGEMAGQANGKVNSAAAAGDKTAGSAADKATAAKEAGAGKAAAAGEQVMPCNEMIKAHVVFPTKMAELMTQIADNLEGHAKWMTASKGSKEAKAEADALKKIAADHRTLAAQMKKAAATMEKASAIAPAPHDMKAMDPKAGEGMLKQAALEKEIGGMMIKDAAETDKMVKGMAAAGGGMAK